MPAGRCARVARGRSGAPPLGAPAAAAVEVYPVTALERGVAGVGYTVVEGTRIEPFDVEILGVMEGAGPAGSLVGCGPRER